jgi:hypothetical protein
MVRILVIILFIFFFLGELSFRTVSLLGQTKFQWKNSNILLAKKKKKRKRRRRRKQRKRKKRRKRRKRRRKRKKRKRRKKSRSRGRGKETIITSTTTTTTTNPQVGQVSTTIVRQEVTKKKHGRGEKWRKRRRGVLSRALAAGFVAGMSYPVLGYGQYFNRYPFDHAFWGPRFFYDDIGLWYYSNLHCWYHPRFRAWFYPRSYCWYYPRLYGWYYPRFYVTVYEAPKSKKVVYVTNSSKSESYFAVYYREKFDGGYYLYSIGNPRIIKSNEKLKIILPSFGSSEDYIVIVDNDKGTLKKSMIQDKSGKFYTKDFDTKNIDKKLKNEKIEVTGELSNKDKKYIENQEKALKKGQQNLDDVAKKAVKKEIDSKK